MCSSIFHFFLLFSITFGGNLFTYLSIIYGHIASWRPHREATLNLSDFKSEKI